MRKTEFLNPLLIYSIISILTGIVFSIIESIDKLMVQDFTRNITYIIEAALLIFLYLFLSNKFLKKVPNKTVLSSVFIILIINLVLGLSGYLMTNLGSGIMTENGQVPIMIFIFLNSGFFSLLSLSTLPELLNIILMCLLSPILLYLGSKKLVIFKK